jgi:murein DD-endopeptidase MepM/ murein hydrolase activator NlpD
MLSIRSRRPNALNAGQDGISIVLIRGYLRQFRPAALAGDFRTRFYHTVRDDFHNQCPARGGTDLLSYRNIWYQGSIRRGGRLYYRFGMNIYRSGEADQRKPILKPLSAGKTRREPNATPSFDLRRTPAPSSEATASLHDEQASSDHHPLAPGVADTVRASLAFPDWNTVSEVDLRRMFQRSVQAPVWVVAVLAFVLVVAPVASVLLLQDRSTGRQPDEVAAQSSELIAFDEPLKELMLLFEAERFFEPAAPTRSEPPAVSSREEFLLDGGVNPNGEVRYAADEVERLQAELEAIQRNSSLLRSLARQQSGDLTVAYSSLELTQEQKDGALDDLRLRIDDLESRIRSVDELARELRDLLGMPPSEIGVGGPSPQAVDDGDPWLRLRAEIVAIEQWAGELVFDLDEINTEIQLRAAMVSQTSVPRGASLGADIQYFDSMPMGWPVEGPITSRFGMRASPFAGEGGQEMHTGIDIAARTGTPVIATGGGTIIVSGDNGGYGLLVVIDHGRGVTTWYGHNSRLLVAPGQRVNAGDVIAEVGSTGRSTGPHVHYEVRVNGVPSDPLPYMEMQR